MCNGKTIVMSRAIEKENQLSATKYCAQQRENNKYGQFYQFRATDTPMIWHDAFSMCKV